MSKKITPKKTTAGKSKTQKIAPKRRNHMAWDEGDIEIHYAKPKRKASKKKAK